MTAPKRFAVLGDPIAHSLSPIIHQSAYRVLKLGWEYDKKQLKAAEFQDFITQNPGGYSGFSVTMPLKELAAKLATVKSDTVQLTGIANTLKFTPAGLSAENTDIPALQLAISDLQLDCTNTLILGAGATALSAAIAVIKAGVKQLTVAARNTDSAQNMLAKLQRMLRDPLLKATKLPKLEFAQLEQITTAPTLVISTLPGEAQAQFDPRITSADLLDVAYHPDPSFVAAKWQNSNAITFNGLEMLTRQALLQLRFFIGQNIATPLPEESAVFAAICDAVRVK